MLPDPVKPQSDPKKYRHVKLNNGLHILLISDVCEDNQLKEIYDDAQFEIEDFDSGSESDSGTGTLYQFCYTSGLLVSVVYFDILIFSC